MAFFPFFDEQFSLNLKKKTLKGLFTLSRGFRQNGCSRDDIEMELI